MNNLSNIYFLDLNIGAHTPFQKSVFETIKFSLKYGMSSTQFFLGNPQSFNRHSVLETDINNCKEIIKKWNINVFTHSPYLYNLAGSIDCLAWIGNNIQDNKTENVLKNLEYELNIIAKLNGKGVVVHPGNYKDRKEGLKTIAKSINKINFNDNACLLLENSAGQGNSLATTFLELKEIYEQIDENKQKHIGICIDTAHIFGYGEYDISKPSEVNRMFKEFDNILGMNKLKLLHLNDSKVDCGSKRDCHELLSEGKIWYNDISSLILLLDICKTNNIPIILETNISDILFLAKIKINNK